MSAQGWVVVAGWFNLAFAVIHAAFWWLFRWRSDLVRLRPVNRVITQVLNVMLTYVFAAVAAGQLLQPEEFAGSVAGRGMLAGMAGFWVLRAGLQPLFRGVAGRGVQAAFYALFLLGAVLHLLAWRAGG